MTRILSETELGDSNHAHLLSIGFVLIVITAERILLKNNLKLIVILMNYSSEFSVQA